MESKRLNVTEEWFQLITELTLKYQRNLRIDVSVDDSARESVKLKKIIMAPGITRDVKRENQTL